MSYPITNIDGIDADEAEKLKSVGIRTRRNCSKTGRALLVKGNEEAPMSRLLGLILRWMPASPDKCESG